VAGAGAGSLGARGRQAWPLGEIPTATWFGRSPAGARFHAAVSQGLSIRQNKLLEFGALLLLLWPWLGRLTTNQRRRFLKSLGVPNVPGKEALREYERCLEVKDLYVGWAREDEQKRPG
jgi:hypothetical protein